MKRQTIPLIALAGASLAFAQSGAGLLSGFASSLSDAKTLHATYTFQKVGGFGDVYTVDLKKADMARVDTPTTLYVADGKTIVTLNKAEKTYFKKPETREDLLALFDADALKVWKGFFGTVAMPARTRDLGSVQRGGTSLKGIEAVYTSQTTSRYYLGSDNLPRQAEFETNSQAGRDLSIFNATSVTAGGDIPADTFRFDPPTVTKEISLEEATSVTWLTSLDEAKKVAKATGKQIFVDFLTPGSDLNKQLDKDVFHSAEFKALGKKVVFLKIDVEHQQPVAMAYGVTKTPTLMVLNTEGGIVGSQVGYSDKTAFMDWLKPLVP